MEIFEKEEKKIRFKVGDKVERINNETGFLPVGTIGIISEVQEFFDGKQVIKLDNFYDVPWLMSEYFKKI